jgi:hypothetical protein
MLPDSPLAVKDPLAGNPGERQKSLEFTALLITFAILKNLAL